MGALRGIVARVFAIGGTVVAGSVENRYAFGDALLIRRVEGLVVGRAILRLAVTVADAHDRWRGLHVDRVLDRKQDGMAGGFDDGGAGGAGAPPLDVEGRFAVLPIDTWIAAPSGMYRRQRSRRINRQTQHRAERSPVAVRIQIGIFDHVDGLALAGVAAIEDRIEVINRGEICRRHAVAGRAGDIADVIAATRLRFRRMRAALACLVVRSWLDIFQA